MIKEFDHASLPENKINLAKKGTNNINRSLALEFADSIRITYDTAPVPVKVREERPASKDNRLKDVFSPKQTKKNRKLFVENLMTAHSIKNKSKGRVHSETWHRQQALLSVDKNK